MILNDIASVRTGLVAARKKASAAEAFPVSYRMLNLKCVSESGGLNLDALEAFCSKDTLKPDYLAQMGDILIRLSAPYTAVMITDEAVCGCVIPSHFAIIRVDRSKAAPEYVFWALRRPSTRQRILRSNSGSSAFGTISSGFFANLPIREIPLREQKMIGYLLMLSEKERELLCRLADEKSRYGKALVNQLYDSVKRGD